MSNPSLLETQYSECWNDIRDHRTRMWQIAASSIALTVAFAGVLTQVHVVWEMGILAATTAFLVLIFYIQLRKERFFEKVRTSTLESIQEKLEKREAYEGVHISWRTEKIIEDIRQGRLKYDGFLSRIETLLEKLKHEKNDQQVPWFERRSAFNWLDRMMVVLIGGLVATSLGFFAVATQQFFNSYLPWFLH